MRIITFGEIMLRLRPEGFERFFQSSRLEATFGGGEANVAVSLANFGEDVAFITVLPDNPLGIACRDELRKYGVDTKEIIFSEGRLGIYFLETGSNQRPSKVVYDRADSCMSRAQPGAFEWPRIFWNADWFHISGITPAISESAASLSLDAVKAARRAGVTVSIDLNYRKNLWKYTDSPKAIMSELAEYVDVVIANEEDIQKSLGITCEADVTKGKLDESQYETLAKALTTRYPNVKAVAITLRESKSANHNDWSACLYTGENFYVSKKYEIRDIVDRVGGGDSFSAGLIYGFNHYPERSDALEFAVAASCLKHTIGGDFNRVSVKEIEALMGGDGSGRVQR